MQRRRFIQLGAAGVVVVGGGAAAASWLGGRRAPEDLSLSAIRGELDRFERGRLTHLGAWNPAQIFAHCAQSVEYSLSGFPQPKSPAFQKSVGAAVFSVFSSSRRMRHGLAEPIPGAPPIPATGDVGVSLARLRTALDDFERHEGAMAPHFAYGALSKAEYEQAHALHCWNHFEELVS